jgi:hypothetical protein
VNGINFLDRVEARHEVQPAIGPRVRCSKAYPVWESVWRWRSLRLLISRIEHSVLSENHIHYRWCNPAMIEMSIMTPTGAPDCNTPQTKQELTAGATHQRSEADFAAAAQLAHH